ncbi:MAG: hypothetical protein B7Z55_13815 [Planctomycetales bacterium 12-60-4]|nr:MAG: hypothetical protein B7Z55_13815 [Planctomycetales bacterium 12-60-4]
MRSLRPISTWRLTLQYILSLGTLASLALGNYLILVEQIHGQQSMAAVVTISSEQRSLLQGTARISQQLLIAAAERQTQPPTLRRDLQHELDIID